MRPVLLADGAETDGDPQPRSHENPPGFHHVELWLADPARELPSWEWLLERLGFTRQDSWPDGQSWAAGGSYLVLTASPNLSAPDHDRRRPGLNHLAFRAGSRDDVDRLMADAVEHGWKLLYGERFPHAGGPDHYAGWLENEQGFKVEVVG